MLGQDEALLVATNALWLIVRLCLPALLVTTAIGMVITVLQGMTRINEQSIQQNFKVFATLIIVFVTAPGLYEGVRLYWVAVMDHIDALAMP